MISGVARSGWCLQAVYLEGNDRLNMMSCVWRELRAISRLIESSRKSAPRETGDLHSTLGSGTHFRNALIDRRQAVHGALMTFVNTLVEETMILQSTLSMYKHSNLPQQEEHTLMFWS